MGHKLSGFFSVKGSEKLEMVFCDFNPNENGKPNIHVIGYNWLSINSFVLSDKQKWIGYADVKSAPVHFYVQRNSTFYTHTTPVPFDLARINEGNAMNLTSGKFTASRQGVYYFSLTGWMANSNPHSLGLYLNGALIGRNWSPTSSWSPLNLHSTLHLKKGDQVWLQMYAMSSIQMYDDADHRTHFTGFLLEEEVVASF
jgi:hypothetical protein